MSHSKQIVKLLTANAVTKRTAIVFDDFVEMAALSLRNAVDQHDRAEWNQRETRYLQLTDTYTSEQLDRFAEAFALVVLEMEREPSDVLGRIFMDLDLGNERLGQFYTPYSVAELIAEMNVESLVDAIDAQGHVTLHEPACGAGAMLIATTQALHRRGVNFQRSLRVTAEDIAPQAVRMTFIHMTLLHVQALIHRRNTLTQETIDTWPSPAYLLRGATW